MLFQTVPEESSLYMSRLEYIPKNCLSTDIITIGESPLAIMQGEYIDYRNINVSLVARLLCKGFHPTSS